MSDIHPTEPFMSLRYLDAQTTAVSNPTPKCRPAELQPQLCYILQEHVVVSFGVESIKLERRVEHGELVFIPPHTPYALASQPGRTAQVVFIRFHCGDTALLLPDKSQIHSCRLPQVRGWMEAFLHASQPELHKQLQLQSYLYAMCAAIVYAAETSRERAVGMEQYIEQTLHYMNRHYSDSIDIEALARHSGSSAGRFYQAFKTRTGLSPLKYMTRLRMDAALEALGSARSSVLDVAHAIGYEDEYYFSRLFKKQMGITPTEYAERAQKRVACLSPVIEGDLTALGVTPVLSLAKGWSRQPSQALQRIRASRPDLILTSPVAADIAEDLYRELGAIAPIVVLYWKRNSWRERFRETAGHLDLSSVAERWLAYYSLRVENARAHVRRRLGDAPHLVVIASGAQFLVFGIQPKVNELFYEDLQVMPPARLHTAALLSMSSLDEVAGLGCGNIVLLADETCPDDYCTMLEESWRKLKQQHGDTNCLIVRHVRPQAYHAQGRDELIDQTVQHLLQTPKYA